MKAILLLCIVLSLMSSSLFAEIKSDPAFHREGGLRGLSATYLYTELLDTLEGIDSGLEKARVYLSDSIEVEHQSLGSLTDSVSEENAFVTKVKGQVLRVKVNRLARGKILEVLREDNEYARGRKTLFVSYDSECKDRKCSFVFVEGTDGLFHLSGVPREVMMNGKTEFLPFMNRVLIKKLMIKIPAEMMYSNDTGHYTTEGGRKISLRIDTRNVVENNIKVIRLQGIE